MRCVRMTIRRCVNQMLVVMLAIGLGSCQHKSIQIKPYEFSSNSDSGFDNSSELRDLHEYYLQTRGQEVRFESHTSFNQHNLAFSDVKHHFVENCNPCHNGSGLAPFSFDSYKGILKRSKPILESLETMIMPPWPADTTYSGYCNEQTISSQARSEMIEWLKAGAPIGNDLITAKLSHEQKTMSSNLIPPQTNHTISTDSNSYACFVYNPKFDKDTFVSSVQFASSNPEALHHLTLFIDTIGKLDGRQGCWVCTKDDVVDGLAVIETWTKGMRPISYTENIGYRFPKDSKFLLQAHYENNHKGEKEGTTLGFNYIPKPDTEVKWLVLNNFEIKIEANTIESATLSHELVEDAVVFGVGPHLHYICKVLEVFAVTPEQNKIPLLFIPKWDYLLQTKYILSTPVSLPKGTVIYANAIFDNTDGNPVQPNHPVRDVIYDVSENDEMFVLTVFYADKLTLEQKNCVAQILK